MRKFQLSFLSLILLSIPLWFCTKNETGGKEKETKIIDISGDLSFGSVGVNTTDSKPLTIKNTGTSSVNISSITAPQGFSVDWSGGTIEAGGSKQISVRFAPTQAQSYSGEITIQSDAVTATNKIQVSGEGKVNVADYETYKKNYFEVDNSSYVRSLLPASSPSSSTSPQISDVQGNSYVLTGGSNIINFRSSNTVVYVLIGIDGVDGYYRINESALTRVSANYYTFNLAISQTLILQSIKFKIAYVDTRLQISNYFILPASEIPAGTGLLQINCTWLKHNDVDLHVIEPNGEEIFFGNNRSSNGGELDVDSNPNCALDYKENENVNYSTGALVQAGRYIVKANLYSACNVTENTDVTLRARYNGELLKDAYGNTSFTVTLKPSDANQGGKGYGKEVIYVNINQTQTARSVFTKNTVEQSKYTKAEKSDDPSGRLLHFQFKKPSNRSTKK
ncbi:MAG: choice-of-anchor D domain-containing protein [Niabella sp.]